MIIFIIVYLGSLCFVSLRNRNNDLLSENDTDDDNQPLLMVIFMILVGGLLLWLGSESLVYGSKNLAELVGIPNELIGFTLIAIGTSLPELQPPLPCYEKTRLTCC